MSIPTPHIEAKKEDIAKTVLMPGDPLRAKYIAEHFLENARCVNQVRNMLAFTGEYQGKKVTVFGGGMGMPSVGIYSYELFNFYDVDTIIRIGSAGSLSEQVKLHDIVIGIGASTDSEFASQYNLPGHFAPVGDFELARRAVEFAEKLGVHTVVGNVLSTDIFYHADEMALQKWADMGVLAVEMEIAALYCNAAKAKKKALGILTISDAPLRGESLPSKEREVGFTDMMKIALEIA